MDFNELLDLIAVLRSENGCPWDREQTTGSLKPFIVEETYEVLEAIDEKDPVALKEELGDLLFQILFICRLASEKGEFDIHDVIDKIGSKMIARHPHVFGDAEYRTAEEVLEHWDVHKKKEGKLRESVIEGIPQCLPSLQRAQKLQERVSAVGFDWERPEDVLLKLDEELDEFKNAVKEKKHACMEEELGDILFVLVNIAKSLSLNAEDSLRKTVNKFITRFRHMEKTVTENGRKLSDMTLAEMDALWDEAKKEKG